MTLLFPPKVDELHVNYREEVFSKSKSLIIDFLKRTLSFKVTKIIKEINYKTLIISKIAKKNKIFLSE
jgi:hypothetical protein